jgi:hypothetical protein
MVLTELIIVAERQREMANGVTVGATPAPITSPIAHRTGGGIQNNIPRKSAKIPVGNPFPQHTAGHDTVLGFEGLSYNVTFTETDTPPLSGQYNNATLPQVPALQVTTPGRVVPVNNFTRLHPFESAVLHTSGKARPIVKRAGGGPSPSTDTPFHPTKPSPAPVQRSRPTPVALKKFHSNNNNAGSFLDTGTSRGTLIGNAPHDLGTSRWATIKVGAAG